MVRRALGLLLTVGDHGFDGNGVMTFPQRADVHYGKIMLLDMRGGAVPFVRGGNYGWPLATYGTDYNKDVWPLAPTARNHAAPRPPAGVIPSIA